MCLRPKKYEPVKIPASATDEKPTHSFILTLSTVKGISNGKELIARNDHLILQNMSCCAQGKSKTGPPLSDRLHLNSEVDLKNGTGVQILRK